MQVNNAMFFIIIMNIHMQLKLFYIPTSFANLKLSVWSEKVTNQNFLKSILLSHLSLNAWMKCNFSLFWKA